MKKILEMETCTFVLLVPMSIILKISIYALIGEGSQSLPLLHLSGCGFGLIIPAIIAREIYKQIVQQGQAKCSLQFERRQFLALNVDTVSDNKYKMQWIKCYE